MNKATTYKNDSEKQNKILILTKQILNSSCHQNYWTFFNLIISCIYFTFKEFCFDIFYFLQKLYRFSSNRSSIDFIQDHDSGQITKNPILAIKYIYHGCKYFRANIQNQMNFEALHPMYYMWTVNTNLFMTMNPPSFCMLDRHPFNFQNSQGDAEMDKKDKTQITCSSDAPAPKKTKATHKLVEDQDFQILKNKKKKVLMDQKEGRNAVSNILRSFFKFLESSVANKLFEKIQGNTLTKKEILRWFQQNDIHYRNYIRMMSIKNMLRRSSNEYRSTFIYLLDQYLNNYCRLHFLNSQKLKQKNKMVTLKQIRLIKEELQEQLIQQQ